MFASLVPPVTVELARFLRLSVLIGALGSPILAAALEMAGRPHGFALVALGDLIIGLLATMLVDLELGPEPGSPDAWLTGPEYGVFGALDGCVTALMLVALPLTWLRWVVLAAHEVFLLGVVVAVRSERRGRQARTEPAAAPAEPPPSAHAPRAAQPPARSGQAPAAVAAPRDRAAGLRRAASSAGASCRMQGPAVSGRLQTTVQGDREPERRCGSATRIVSLMRPETDGVS